MNDIISITEREGFRILRYANGKWVACGNYYSGKIEFLYEGKTKCEFMQISGKEKKGELILHFDFPKDEGLSGLSKLNLCMKWRSADGSEVKDCHVDKCCLASFQRVSVSPPITALYSALAAGSKEKSDFSPKDEDGNISVNLLYLALFKAPERPEFIRRELMQAIRWHPRTDLHFEDNSDYASSINYENFLNFVEPLILSWTRQGDSKLMKQVANLLEKIEKKTRSLEKSEMDFLKAVNEASEKIFDVPTQKDVREIWLKQQSGRDEKNYRDVRDRLAFSWLPSAKRGKNAHGRKG